MTSKKKILTVDDEDGITDYVQSLFETAGFEVKTANGGWQAWEQICQEAFDFVITDVRMDHGDGIELVEKVRDMADPKPMIAVMSAYTDVLISDIYDRGAVAFIAKPPKSSSLLNIVKNVNLLLLTYLKDQSSPPIVLTLNRLKKLSFFSSLQRVINILSSLIIILHFSGLILT